MFNSTAIIGVDPGLRTTGLVKLVPPHQISDTLEITSLAIDHPKEASNIYRVTKIVEGIYTLLRTDPDAVIVVEDFRLRPGVKTSSSMIEIITLIRSMCRAEGYNLYLLNNMGSKKVIPEATLRLLELSSWKTPTHHDDLKAAARIALFNIVKQKSSWLPLWIEARHFCKTKPAHSHNEKCALIEKREL